MKIPVDKATQKKMDKIAKLKRNKLKNSVRVIKPKVVHHKHTNLVDEVDRVFSHYIRFVRDKDKPCITCWRHYDEYDCGHFQVRTHMNTRYSEMNVARQCWRCNGSQWGEQLIFSRRIDEIYWEGTAEAIEILARTPTQIKQFHLLEIYQKYYALLVENKIPFIPIKKYLWN